jgi:hypothetical protein
MNSQKMLSVIVIVIVLTITAFGSFAVVIAPVLAQNITTGNMTGGNMTSMMSDSTS